MVTAARCLARSVVLTIFISVTADAGEVPSASPQEESKRLLLSNTWEAHVWGPYGKGHYPAVKCQERGTDVLCAYSGGGRNQEIKYEILANGELRTTTTRGVPVILTPKGDGFETLSREAGILLKPVK